MTIITNISDANNYLVSHNSGNNNNNNNNNKYNNDNNNNNKNNKYNNNNNNNNKTNNNNNNIHIKTYPYKTCIKNRIFWAIFNYYSNWYLEWVKAYRVGEERVFISSFERKLGSLVHQGM